MGFVDGDGGVLGNRANGSLLGIDSIPNFSSFFYFPGFDSFGNLQFTWQYTMVGKSPFKRGDDDDDGEVTRIRAPVIPVTVDLRNADGSPRFVNGQRLISSPAAYVAPTLASPIFEPTSYSSSFNPTQFTDAVMRAEFHGVASHDWHTLLNPSVKTGRTMALIQGTYRFALNGDGTCCAFILVDANAYLAGMVYHVQNEALLQWFAGQTPSTAINGAYSYPDPVLTTPSVSRNPGCK
jgi:hypothetical protein